MSGYRTALAGALCFAVLGAGCRGCAERAETAPGAPDAGTAKLVVPGGPQILPLEVKLIGDMDIDNRYNSTVSLRPVPVPDGNRYGGCSGVLIADDLVLT